MLKRINAWDVEKHCRIDEWVDVIELSVLMN